MSKTKLVKKKTAERNTIVRSISIHPALACEADALVTKLIPQKPHRYADWQAAFDARGK